MLYDPKWEAPVETKPSLQGFIGWLETKNPKERYRFWECNGRCLLGQYMAYAGIEWTGAPLLNPHGSWDGSSYIEVARSVFGRGVDFTVLTDRPHTFGGALKRAREWAVR